MRVGAVARVTRAELFARFTIKFATRARAGRPVGFEEGANAQQFFRNCEIALHRENFGAKATFKSRLAFPRRNDRIVSRARHGSTRRPAASFRASMERRNSEIAALRVFAVFGPDPSGCWRVAPRPFSTARS